MSEPPKGRGRGRGGRGKPLEQAQGQGQVPGQPQAPRPGLSAPLRAPAAPPATAPAAPSAWPRPTAAPAQSAQSTGAIPRPRQSAAQPPSPADDETKSMGRGGTRKPPTGAVREVGAKMQSLHLGGSNGSGSDNGNGNGARGNGNGNGNGDPSVGRGSWRGKKRIETDNIGTPHTRPTHVVSKQGKSGTMVKLQANYFALETRATWVVFQYRVDFKIPEDRTPVLKAWIREHRQRLGTNYLFDGSMLFTSQRLTPNDEILQLVSVRQEDNTPVPIEIRLVGELHKGHYMYLQIFNILVRRCLDALKLQLVGRNYFDPLAKVCLPDHHIELWPGYVTSIRQHEDQILMVAEITHKVMRTDTVSHLLAECIKASPDEWKAMFQNAILGQVVLTDYTNKTYRVDDVVFNENPATTFEGKNNEKTSFIDYYQKRYNIRIRDRNQPLLISRPTQRDIRGGRREQIKLIPELCRLTGLTDVMRANFRLMSAMAEHTRVSPEARIEKLLAFNRRLHSEPSITDELRAWNFTLSKNLVEFDGRVLGQEKIIVKESSYAAGPDADWTRELRSRPMLHNADFRSFLVIVPGDLKRDAEGFLQTLQRSGSGMKFNIPKPDIVEVRSDRIPDVIGAVENYIASRTPSLVMFIVSNNKGDRYSAIKKKCCVDRAIPSQVVLRKNLTSKGVMSICTKIAIQLNCKLGGAPWSVAIPSKQSFMIVGYDVCHDSSDKSKSVGAFVASLNQAMNIWFSSVNFHKNGEELSNHVAMDITLALRKYRDINGNLPDRIVVYRDGVGEGQIHYVHHFEVKQITDALDKVYAGAPWKLGYIIVTKRINTRIFLQRKNPPPGTIADNVITSPEKYDFFLVSQSVRQGTVSPTSYNIIYDTLGMAADHIQLLTYKMTHLYYNWSGTVRVPAPCQYAHKLAFLVGQSLHIAPSVELSGKLYFL